MIAAFQFEPKISISDTIWKDLPGTDYVYLIVFQQKGLFVWIICSSPSLGSQDLEKRE